MPRGEAQASEHNRTMQDILHEFQISDYSETQLNALVEYITYRSKPHFHKFLLYVLQFVEYNRSRYLQLKYDLSQVREELASLKDELTAIMVSTAPSPQIAAIQLATLPPPLASQATAPPLASQTTAPPLASQTCSTFSLSGYVWTCCWCYDI